MTATKHVASGACPGFFRALCREAAQGGADSYARAGYELARHLGDVIDDNVQGKLLELSNVIDRRDERGWIRSLDRFLESDDASFVINWFRRELPRCMALVPARRHRAFLKGVYEYAMDEENDITL